MTPGFYLPTVECAKVRKLCRTMMIQDTKNLMIGLTRSRVEGTNHRPRTCLRSKSPPEPSASLTALTIFSL